MRHLTASEITESALKEFAYRGFECWRQNQIPVRGRRFTGKPGLADIIGFNKYTGIMLMCEVKTKMDKISDEQWKLLCDLKGAGGFAMIATENDKGNIEIMDFLKYQETKLKL